MRNLQTFDEWLAENELNEFLKTDLRKLQSFIIDLSNKIKDSKAVADIKQIASSLQIDPYMTYKKIMDEIADSYKNNKEVMKVISSHV